MLFALPELDGNGTPVLELWSVREYFQKLDKYIRHYIGKDHAGDVRPSGWIDQEEAEMKIQFTRHHFSLTGTHEDWTGAFERWCDAKVLVLQSDHLHVPDRAKTLHEFSEFLRKRKSYLEECPTMQNN